ncbi:uncharacterized protein LOC120172466 isoform X1 [Hibiscus syriacus]|uniref:uncharacterized protein LOC120172466 isoform X1 n=1 Tax=Hibiscus syriacus TaxID=106335 RepID=UPI001924921D|nr:uncharacterized protein LOC120172466 isoform X1 [Hibiscus syriacus]
MEAESGGDTGKTRIATYWYWAVTSATQFGWAVSSCREGYSGDHRLMPVKAFGVASLFLGASATVSIAFLKASGIHNVIIYLVEDLMDVGASIRTGLGIRPRAGDKGSTSFQTLEDRMHSSSICLYPAP